MMTRFRVKNYKCLKDVEIPLTPIHVLIGDNASGKTSVLEAMYALYTSGNPYKQHVPTFPLHSKHFELVNSSATQKEIEIGGNFVWSTDPHVKPGVEYDCNRKFTFAPNQPIPSVETTGSLVPTTNSNKWEVRKYSLNPRMLALPNFIDMSKVSPEHRFEIEEDGFGLTAVLDEILNYDDELFRSLRDAFHQQFDQYVRIRLEKSPAFRKIMMDGSAYPMLINSDGKEVRLVTTGRSEHRLQNVSDGTVLTLAFLTLCHIPSPPNLLLIEEPENGVYPKRLREVVARLKKLVSDSPDGPQVILTTHSPYLLSEFEPEEVTFMQKLPDGSVRARPLRDSRMVKERLGTDFAYLGELWYNYDEEAIFGDAEPAPRD